MAHPMVARLAGKPITWILAVALFLRVAGIGYALPQFFVNDERAIVYGALKMYELKTLVPAWHEDEFKKVLSYLPVSSYIFAVTLAPVLAVGYLFSGVSSVPLYQSWLVLDPTLIFLAARAVVALLGVCTIYLTYRFARELFASERAGLLTAMFLAVSFYHLQLSEVTRHWMPALVFMSLAWLASLRIFERGRARDYIAAGIFAGVALGANTAGAIVMIPAVLAHMFRRDGGGFFERLFAPRLWLGVLTFSLVALAFILLWPYGLSQGEVPGGGAGEAIRNKVVGLSEKNLGEWLVFLGYYARLLVTYETALLVAAIGGMALAFRRARSWVAIAVAFIIGYLTLLYLFFNIIPRGALFVLPVLAVFAGFAVDRALLKIQMAIPPTVGMALILFIGAGIVLFLPPFVTALRYDYLLIKPDSRIVAADWVYANIPRDAKILADLPALRLTNTKDGIRTLERIDESGLRIQDRTLIGIPDSQYPQPSREVLNLHFVSADNPYRTETNTRFFVEKGYRYFVVEYEYSDGRDLAPQSRLLVREGRLVRRFLNSGSRERARAIDISGEIATITPGELWGIERFGMIVDVYDFLP